MRHEVLRFRLWYFADPLTNIYSTVLAVSHSSACHIGIFFYNEKKPYLKSFAYNAPGMV
jgi:hypothetical protein